MITSILYENVYYSMRNSLKDCDISLGPYTFRNNYERWLLYHPNNITVTHDNDVFLHVEKAKTTYVNSYTTA